MTLVASYGAPASYSTSSNSVIRIESFMQSYYARLARAIFHFTCGTNLAIGGHRYGLTTIDYNTTLTPVWTGGHAVLTGVTNINVVATDDTFALYGTAAALTLTISSQDPSPSIPANSVVIPTDAKGPVEILLESSADLLNWNAAAPGTYGSTHSNRFFRVRAVAQ
jgi:hypothetical protein